MKKILSLGILMPLLVAMLPGISPTVMAQVSDVPEITMFYPADREGDPMELKTNTKAYLYFKTGSRVKYAKARVMQNGTELGTCYYRATTPTNPGTYTILNQELEENAAILSVTEGVFSLEVYEVNYINSLGIESTYSGATIGTVTYRRPATPGTIVAETGLDGRTIRSYYPADGTEGVKTYTFSKPVSTEGLSPYFEYGSQDVISTTNLPWTLSDDGLTLTIDLRGKCYNPDVLAPGVTFYDENGNPTDPPTTINIIINSLKGTDGSLFTTTSVSLDEQFSIDLSGRLHQTYHYENITFPTPAIESVEFYAASAPQNTFLNINADTDMMKMGLANASYIASANVTFTAGNTVATVADADITKSANTWRMALPAEIKAAGSGNLVISLTNVTFTAEDGATHIIHPWDMSGTTTEVSNIAELKALEAGTEVVMNIDEGLTITLSNDAGYTFGEDRTGGIMILTEDYSRLFDESTMITGKLAGSYQGFGMFMVNADASEYTAQDTDTTDGIFVSDMNVLEAVDLEFRLITFENTNETPIVPDGEFIIIGGTIPVITDFIEDFRVPEKIEKVTGVLYNDLNTNTTYLLPRSENDIVGGTTGINGIVTDSDNAVEYFNLQGIRVGSDARGIIITKGRKTLR